MLGLNTPGRIALQSTPNFVLRNVVRRDIVQRMTARPRAVVKTVDAGKSSAIEHAVAIEASVTPFIV